MKTVSVAKFLPGKKKVETVCVCDCIPCKTDTCDRCELPKEYGGINALCNEECNSDYVSGFNSLHSIAEQTEVGLESKNHKSHILEVLRIAEDEWKKGYITLDDMADNIQKKVANVLPELLVKVK